jgi:hypothetical protein
MILPFKALGTQCYQMPSAHPLSSSSLTTAPGSRFGRIQCVVLPDNIRYAYTHIYDTCQGDRRCSSHPIFWIPRIWLSFTTHPHDLYIFPLRSPVMKDVESLVTSTFQSSESPWSYWRSSSGGMMGSMQGFRFWPCNY